MREYGIVTLSRFPNIFENLLSSVNKLVISPTRKIVVTSGGNYNKFYKDWEKIEGIEPFNFSRNANLGLSMLRGMDILLVNDDVQFTDAITPVMGIVESNDDIGIVSPQIIGGVGNIYQSYKHYKIDGDFIISRKRLAFVCVYIRKEVFEKIGYLDEKTFSSDDRIEYGGEDDDFCTRAIMNGFKLAVTRNMIVKHGFEQYEWSSSYLQIMSETQREKSMSKMRIRLLEKYA